MSNTNTGGQAFPCLERGGNGLDLTDGGMTLRDWFAGKAMQAMLAAIPHDYTFDADSIAKSAYDAADAMLKARGV